ncbi:MAG: 5'-nucleotidase C-terminal domain-containing protein [Paramuribaculum sp.]|nr:5'-nucleotidase C-terminal domain-containing protein [Paramuribaculum sp.]
MNRRIFLSGAMAFSILTASAMSKHLQIAYTTDVHGCFFPTNYSTLTDGEGSLARIMTAVDSLRSRPEGKELLLLDNGDILQGQPTAYYYNYIDTTATHLVSEILNYMGYDATTIGNHDVETGHPVYDRFRRSNSMPMLGANVIDINSGEPYFQPYAVFDRNGIRVAVLGMITPGIPSWLPEILWSGLRFDDMTETARKWIPIIKEKEHPDIIVGLFHSGHNEASTTGNVIENASVKVAREVPGFDVILMGHDHRLYNETITNVEGKSVKVLNPANNARYLGLVDIDIEVNESDNAIQQKSIRTGLIDVRRIEPSQDFMNQFRPQCEAVHSFVNRTIGECQTDLSADDAFFGPSKFMSLLHKLQLEISGADISFAAPLSFGAMIRKGPVRVSDMFTLYKYENMLYVMELTGAEIKNYLEESYSLWTAQLKPGQPHIINFASDSPTASDNRLSNPAYNFDSAAGVNYTVDITKPKGEKITITGMSDGRVFDPAAKYTVAVNSYRGNGGGDLLTKGAGISHEELSGRVMRATEKDLRYYLIKEIEKNPVIEGSQISNWKFIPEQTAAEAIAIDRKILFSPESSKEQK